MLFQSKLFFNMIYQISQLCAHLIYLYISHLRNFAHNNDER